ncbi:HtaA domain-containing protein [Conexibacter stalactiti]|uniref:HtaA domain-containing protein n=1 Tax=Conexibacter stalactiti TaxID=1940611 RepID=A0ABU4HT01_9ACTN|nr:HtaA domain-containing protein [Conexibacter stalactiti]MDW5596426.1 HtaA domain-containing protein [Conexibacter stalactiti]MEC5037068.1 HtaA domain-containing protein [Conexibacter stalactiti]
MRRTKATLAAVAGVAALAAAVPAGASAAAGWTPVAPIPASGSAGYPSVAYDADGTATALWLQNMGEQVLKSATKPAGGNWSQPTTLTGSYSSNGKTALAVADDGTATAVWRNDTRIETATRGSDGSWTAVEPISVDGDNPTSPPSIVVDDSGTATAAWSQGCAVIVSTRPARSDTWSNPRAIFTVTEDPCGATTAGYGTIPRAPALGVDRDGNVTAVWRTGTNSGSSVRTLKSAVRTGGPRGTWSAPKLIAEPAARATTNQLEPKLVVDVDGRAVVTWPVFDGGAAVATRPAGADAAWDATTTPLPSTRSATASVALDAHGRASVAWDVAPDGVTPGAIKLSTVSAAGAWSAPETVATLPEGAAAFAPQLALDDDGGALVAWSRSAGGASPASVEAARRPAGGAWGAVTALAADAPFQTVVGLAGDELGNATVAWPVGPEAVDPSDTSSLTAIATADDLVEPALRTDWSGRADPTANSLHSWVRYLYTFWPSAIPGVPDGPGFVEPSDGATWPDPADRYSWRWGQADAWRDVTNGELVLDQQGTLRFAMPSHGIDIRLVNPDLRVAADGRTARLISDGFASGSMADARAGRTALVPFTNLHVLDVDLEAGGYRAGTAVGRRSWIGAPATMTSIAGQTLGVTYAGAPFGKLTFSAPATVPDREPPVDRRPPVNPPPPYDPPPARPPVDTPRPPTAAPVLRTVRRAAFDRGGVATVASFSCPRGSCVVTVPRSLRVRIAGRRYALRLLAPKTLRAGKRGTVRVQLSRAARRALAGRRFAVRFTVRVRAGATTTSRVVRATLSVPRAARRGAKGRR